MNLRLISAISTLSVAMLATVPAQADGPTSAPMHYVSQPAAPIWSGFYLGGNLGVGFASASAEDVTGIVDMQGFMGGVHGGYNFQRGSMVLGIEADAMRSGLEKSESVDTARATIGVPWAGSVRGRVGLAHEAWLLYATAGLAFGELKLQVEDSSIPLTVSASKSDTGYVVGGGVERRISDRVSGRAEVLHYGYNDLNPLSSFGSSAKVGLDLTVVRAGLSLHLN